MDDIEQWQGGISIRPPDGRFKQVQTPLGYTDLAFRKAVSAFDTAYRRAGRVPTVDDCFKIDRSIPKKTYSGLFTTPEFRSAVEYRGIAWNPEDGLTFEQQMALLKLSDVTDRRSIAAKLKDLGIPMPRYQAWLKQPLFRELLEQQSVDAYAEALPAIRNALIGNAMAGNMPAIELVFAKTGEWSPQQQQVDDARTIVLQIVEAVIRHVRDPETRKAIMADVSLHTATMGAIGQRQTLGG